MKRVHVLERPTPVDELGDFMIDESVFADIFHDKASRTQLRRWRRLKQQMI